MIPNREPKFNRRGQFCGYKGEMYSWRDGVVLADDLNVIAKTALSQGYPVRIIINGEESQVVMQWPDEVEA